MCLDVKKALKIPFTAPGWKIKTGIPLLFILMSYSLLVLWQSGRIFLALLTLVFWILTVGYCSIFVHNEINNKPEPLPDWNFGKCLLTGLQAYVITFSYIIIGLPLIVIFYSLLVSSTASKIIACILGIPVLLIILIYAPIPFTLFAENFKISEALNFSRVLNLCKSGFKDYVKFALWSLLIGLVIGFLSGFCSAFVGLIIGRHLSKIIFMNLTNYISILITLNLSAQTYKNVIKRQELTIEEITEETIPEDSDALDIAKDLT